MAVSVKVPVALRHDVQQVFKLTDPFCAEHLDDEYAQLVRKLVAKLARKRPSPLARGDLRIWAAAAIYTVGSINFLFDRDSQPHLTGDDVSALTGVPKSTLTSKSRLIRDALHTGQLDPEFTRRDVIDRHPAFRMVEVDGLVVDARWLPANVQAVLSRRGIIPDTGGPASQPWRYPGHASHEARGAARARMPVPLGLLDRGDWVPEQVQWGNPSDGHPIIHEAIAAGPRPLYEMEDILSDDDPVFEAIRLREAGDTEGARAVVQPLAAADVRCLEAHLQLGLATFDEDLERALAHFETGVAVGELALGDGFGGVLWWGLAGNRAFLRCLHLYAICLWRLERFEETARVLQSLLWLNPMDDQGIRTLVDAARRGEEWPP